jgi:hypothetical protein
MKKLMSLAITFVLLFSTLAVFTSPVQAATLTIQPSRAPGVYYTDTSIGVSLITYPGATVVYTTNGTNPIASINLLGILTIKNGVKYTGTLYLSSTKTIKAIALKQYYAPSGIYSFKYEVYSPTRLAEAARVKHSSFSYNSYPVKIVYTAANGYTGSFMKTYTGITPGTVNCTWYTYAKSMYYGKPVLFSTPGGLDGKNWYSKAVSNSRQVKYYGNNGLEALITANMNRPVYNIVVSFQRNGTGTNGHVMMIDAIINGVIYYSESSSPGIWRSAISVAAFKSKYLSYNGSIVGVVHLK